MTTICSFNAVRHVNSSNQINAKKMIELFPIKYPKRVTETQFRLSSTLYHSSKGESITSITCTNPLVVGEEFSSS
jgi:hypothetical protein